MARPGEENPRPREKLGEGTESKKTPLSTDNAREEIELSRKKVEVGERWGDWA